MSRTAPIFRSLAYLTAGLAALGALAAAVTLPGAIAAPYAILLATGGVGMATVYYAVAELLDATSATAEGIATVADLLSYQCGLTDRAPRPRRRR